MGGFNTKVEYKGEIYIIQTQDKGPATGYIESLIYRSGRLLSSRRAFYTEHLEKPDLPKIIELMMENEHKHILGEILEGDHS